MRRNAIITWAIAVLAVVSSTGQAHAQLLTGTATATDGDSLVVGSQRVRLFGIDAPELDQTCTTDGSSWPCGIQAKERLNELINGQRVDCQITGLDQYGRTLGRCSTEFLDINEAIVELRNALQVDPDFVPALHALGRAYATKSWYGDALRELVRAQGVAPDSLPVAADLGRALVYRGYSQDYVAAEDRARQRKAGIWNSTFTNPAEHRLAKAPKPPEPRQPVQRVERQQSNERFAGCTIKGNRNRKGQWIYHLPGMPYYDQTRAEEFFCTEDQARAAGYRRAIVR